MSSSRSSFDPEGCPLCGTGDAELLFESRLGMSVRSDWTPLPARARVFRCVACDLIFKPTSLVDRFSDYESYSVWGDSAARDKIEYGVARMATRSGILRSYLTERGLLGAGTAVLDYGCNRGAFLALLPEGPHAGFDVTERYRPMVEKLGLRFFGPADPLPAGAFDVVSLIHVLEHLAVPTRQLSAPAGALKEGGALLVQVPDLAAQPTDVYIMDHRSHFNAATLRRALEAFGFGSGEITSLIGGELTALFRGRGPSIIATGERRSMGEREEDAFDRVRRVLSSGEEALLGLREAGERCVIFGAGLWGTLVGAFLGERVEAFWDDDPSLHGTRLLGIPVAAVPASSDGRTVVVAVPPTAAGRVARRCRAGAFRTVVPFDLDAPANRRSD